MSYCFPIQSYLIIRAGHLIQLLALHLDDIALTTLVNQEPVASGSNETDDERICDEEVANTTNDVEDTRERITDQVQDTSEEVEDHGDESLKDVVNSLE